MFVSGAAAPAVSRLLLALAVLQALLEIGDCGRGMCRWLRVAWSRHAGFVRSRRAFPLAPFAMR